MRNVLIFLQCITLSVSALANSIPNPCEYGPLSKKDRASYLERIKASEDVIPVLYNMAEYLTPFQLVINRIKLSE